MRYVRALPIDHLMPAVGSRSSPAATRRLGGRPGKNERPHPSPARLSGTPSVIMSPDSRPWTQISSLVPFGDARACGKIGRGRSPSISRPWRTRGANRADARLVSCGFTVTRSDFTGVPNTDKESGSDVSQAFSDWAWFAFLLGWIYLAIEMFATAAVELMDHRPEPMVPRWLTWLTIAGAVTVFFAAGPAFFKSGPFAYHGLLAFYVPVVVWGAYIALTTWYMLKELKRAPESTPIPAAASTAD
jgi:hypothetical protein